MSDEALVWKFAFGVLVLLFCGVWLVARQPAQPGPLDQVIVTPVPARRVVTVPIPAASAPAVQAQPAVQPEPVPADVPETQEAPPTRIRIALHEPRPPAPKAAPVKAKPHKAARRGTASGKIHFVRGARRPSPYAIGRKHYPYDPRERWSQNWAGAMGPSY